jgi:hypothetical protein
MMYRIHQNHPVSVEMMSRAQLSTYLRPPILSRPDKTRDVRGGKEKRKREKQEERRPKKTMEFTNILMAATVGF